MNDFYLKKLEEWEADGIDFMSINCFNDKFPNVIASYTKEELKEVKTFPRTAYKFWKIMNGKKFYIA